MATAQVLRRDGFPDLIQLTGFAGSCVDGRHEDLG
jgi:hypothetical protein